jgi:pheromone a factor receptor
MVFRNAVYLSMSIIAWVAALYPLPWHLRTRNIATLSMIFWMTMLNTVHIINSELPDINPLLTTGTVWVDNTKPVAKVWGDISVNVIGESFDQRSVQWHLVRP